MIVDGRRKKAAIKATVGYGWGEVIIEGLNNDLAMPMGLHV